MANPYYTHAGYPANSADGRSVDMRAELEAITAGFNKLPGLTGNAGKLVVVNSSEDGLGLVVPANVGITSWTPTISCVVPGDLNVVYSIRVGSRFTLGGVVVTSMEISTSTWTYTTATGSIIISGMPALSYAVTNAFPAVSYSGFTKAGYHSLILNITSNANTITMYASGSAVALATVAVTDFPTAGTVTLRASWIQGGGF